MKNSSLFSLYVDTFVIHSDDLRSLKNTAEIARMFQKPAVIVNNLSGNVVFRA